MRHPPSMPSPLLWLVGLLLLFTDSHGLLSHAQARRPQEPRWISGKQLNQRAYASYQHIRKMLNGGRSIYIGYNGYFDHRLRWHDLPKQFSDKAIMAKANVLAVYRNGSSLAHRINLRLAQMLYKHHQRDMIGHMFTRTGGRMSLTREGHIHINIAGQSLLYPSARLDLRLLGAVLKRHFHQRPAGLWPHTRKALRDIQRLVRRSQGLVYSEQGDKDALFFYAFHAVYSAVTRDRELVQAAQLNRTSAAFVTTSRQPQIGRRHGSRFAFSLVPFWRNDLDWYCEAHIRRGVALGFQKVALVYPVHYSVHRRSGIGSSFRYLSLAALSQGELDRCLRRVLKAGLDLHFVPHLEDAKTLIANWEVEWRINSGVPLDAAYARRAFGPLLRFLRKHQPLVRRWLQRSKLRVTVAAEVDRMVFQRPRALGQTARWLKQSLRQATGQTIPLIWSPNGDLAAVLADAKRTRPPASRCQELIDAFRRIDGIAPTIYERYQHLGHPSTSKGLLVATRDKFKGWLWRAVDATCHTTKQRRRLRAQWRRLIKRDFSFGELALHPKKKHSYARLHRDFVRHGGAEMILWTTGSWDPVGISRSHVPNRYHQTEILATFSNSKRASRRAKP